MTALTPEKRLERVGLALYGQNWQAQMSRAVGKSPRMIRYYAAGEVAAPPEVWDTLFGIIKTRLGLLAKIAEELRVKTRTTAS